VTLACVASPRDWNTCKPWLGSSSNRAVDVGYDVAGLKAQRVET